MKLLATIALAFPLACFAGPFGFSITQHKDEFTGETFTHGSDLKVCQPKGIASTCAMLNLYWTPAEAESVVVRIDITGGFTSILSLSVRGDEGVRTFDAPTQVTDLTRHSTAARAVNWSSGNSFILPVDALRAIANSQDHGLIRVTGTHSSVDFSFYRKASMKGLPVDHLRTFLAAINSGN